MWHWIAHGQIHISILFLELSVKCLYVGGHRYRLWPQPRPNWPLRHQDGWVVPTGHPQSSQTIFFSLLCTQFLLNVTGLSFMVQGLTYQPQQTQQHINTSACQHWIPQHLEVNHLITTLGTPFNNFVIFIFTNPFIYLHISYYIIHIKSTRFPLDSIIIQGQPP